jgi:hypothetical protein
LGKFWGKFLGKFFANFWENFLENFGANFGQIFWANFRANFFGQILISFQKQHKYISLSGSSDYNLGFQGKAIKGPM